MLAARNLKKTFASYRWLLGYVRAYRRGWVTLFLLTLFNVPLAVMQPWPIKVLFDNVLGTEPLPAKVARFFPAGVSNEALLVWVVVAGLVIFLLNSLFEVALTFAWIRVGQAMIYDFARDLFAIVQRRSMVFHTRNSVGDLMSRIIYDSSCVNAVADTLLLKPFNVLITMTSMIVLMARIDGRLTLLAIVIAPFMAASSVVFGRPVRSAARASREIAGRMQSHVQQTLSGIPVVQAFVQEEREQRRFLEFAGAAVRAEQRNTLATNFYNLGSGLLIALGTAAVLWLGARHVLAGVLTLGTLLIFLSYLASLNGQLRTLAEVYRALQSTRASVERVTQIREGRDDVPELPGAPPLDRIKGRVVFENVSFSYTQERVSLCDVSLEAEPGETLAIVGETGAGKSTLVSLIPRFLDPSAGRVLIDGIDLRTVQIRSLRSQIAVVLQEPFLFPKSVAENIALGNPAASPAQIESAARAANAHEFIARMPDGYETILGGRGATLSGGERQRISIARALLKDAPLLILDEPTSALDNATEALLLEALERLMHGRTTFIVAHRLSTIRNADRILVMSEGRVIESGTHLELTQRAGHYAKLHALQFGGGT